MYLQYSYNFRGDVRAVGAGGKDAEVNRLQGGTGTIYIQDDLRGYTKTTLLVDGHLTSDLPTQHFTVIADDDNVDRYEFDSIVLQGNSRLVFDGASSILQVHQLQGDKTGWLYVADYQTLYAEVVDGRSTHLTTQCNIEISINATGSFASNVSIEQTTLNVDGKLDVPNMIVEANSVLRLSETSYNVRRTKSGFKALSSPGTYLFNSLVLKRESTFSIHGGLDLTGGVFEVKSGVTLRFDYFSITSKNILIERGASFDVSARAPDDPSHPSAGDPSNCGGGGHGGFGGVKSGVPVSEAAPSFGSIYKAVTTGTNGGAGSRGGSYIYIKADEVVLDGELKGNGGDASSGGAGSGGSVWINTKYVFKGLGGIMANGGTASGSCGSGGGGRIAVYTDTPSQYIGSYSAAGGSGSSGRAGGPGSVYLNDIVDSELFEKLIVDNRNKQISLYFTLDEDWIDDKGAIDEIDLSDNVLFHMPSDGTVRSFNMRKVVGDGSALVHIHSEQSVIFERDLEINGTSCKTPVNIMVDEDGEAIMCTKSLIMGKGTVHRALDLSGRLTGVFDFGLGEDREMYVTHTAEAVAELTTDDSDVIPGTFTFGSIEMYSGSKWLFEDNMGAVISAASLDVKFGAVIYADFFRIAVSDLDVEVGSMLSCRGDDRKGSSNVDQDLGSGTTHGSGDAGAGHGSFGGIGYTTSIQGGIPYGSLYLPTERGSRGGSSTKSGRGGGTILINSVNLILDGELSASASLASQSSGSGGSGGSVLIESYTFEGHGVLSANGGNGLGYGGGGSGGRIAVYTNMSSEYRGEYQALGGNGNAELTVPRGGGSGTVYLQEPRNGAPYRRLYIDNKNRPVTQYVTLAEPFIMVYDFDELHIVRKASLHIAEDVSSVSMVVHKVYGDRTGLLHAHDGHQFTVEVIESVPTFTKAPVNFVIDSGGEIIFPATLYVIGWGVPTEKSDVASLEWDGQLTNVAHLIINQAATVQIYPDAHTAIMENGTYVAIGTPGVFEFGTVMLLAESKLNFADDMGMKFSTGETHAKYGAVISAEHIELFTSSLNFETGANLTTSANDRLATGGNYYGSLYTASKRGSDGGAGPGGEGGKGAGYIDIQVAGKLHVDGLIKADGSGAPAGSRGGGGSGGSIRIVTWELEGHGVITAHGGDGDGVRSGGGSGGRLSVYTFGLNHYEGSYQLYGGAGYDNVGTPHGGPGSVYLNELVYGSPYDQLRIDNANRAWAHYYTLDETDFSSYQFDEIHMTRKASLQMSQDDMQRSLKVQTLEGDLTGLIHMHGKHTYTIDVEVNAKTTIKAPVNIRIEPDAIAELASTVDIIGLGEPALHWNGQMLGVRDLRVAYKRKVEIAEKAHTALIVDGEYEYKDEPGTFRFATLEFGSKSEVAFPPPLGITFNVGFLDMKWASRFTAEYFEILASDFYLEPSATLYCSGRGPEDGGPGVGPIKGAGASHATIGGSAPGGTASGTTYGSLYEPTIGGSRGGPASSNAPGPRGGGVIRVKVGAILSLDGRIEVDGLDAPAGSRAGGSSGGAVWVTTGHFRGHGVISASGGHGDHTSGGGAGGRIAVHITEADEYRGALTALGAAGTSNSDRGGTGTAYAEQFENGTWYKRLYLDNQNVNPPKPLILGERNPRTIREGRTEHNFADYAFDELMLKNKMLFQIGSLNADKPSVSAQTILGDATGMLHIQGNQIFYVEYTQAAVHRALPPVNFQVDQYGELFLVPDFRIIGLHDPPFYLDGQLSGVYNLTAAEEKEIVIGPHATNAQLNNGSYIEEPTPGKIRLGVLNLEAKSLLTYPNHMHLIISDINMRYKSSIVAESVKIQASNIHIEGEAVIQTTARGPTEGDSPGGSVGDRGTGAGHGGFGGCADLLNYTTGFGYGSYTKAIHPGSGGGGTNGGQGGSTIEIHVGHELHLDGLLDNRGGDATGGNSGGGSGGSIYITIVLFSGHGQISVNGGAGHGQGCGGAGGRIAVHVSWLREFTGDYLALGGCTETSCQDFNSANGASGTVYYTDTNAGLQFRRASRNEFNETMWEDGYTKLLLDNHNRNDLLPTIIENEEYNYFEFDEIELRNHVVLWLHGKNSTLVAHKFGGDRTGQMHLHFQQKMLCEVVESQSGFTIAPVSFRVDNGAEIIFPSTLFILGTRTFIDGLITGVYDLFVAEGADVVFSSTTQTALMSNGSYAVITSPGNISFSEITVQRGSIMELEKIKDDLTITATWIRIKYEGRVEMNHGNIDTSHGNIESLGVLNLNYTGFKSEAGPGAGWTSDGIGRGAGHGGYGGAPEPLTGGEPYGSLYEPQHLGSGGGSGGGIGGSGGGLLHWQNGALLTIDGFIYLQGGHGEGANAGGGSGGSILIETTNFTGHGEINVNGGNSAHPDSQGRNGLGYGGAGGRIGIHARHYYAFAGQLKSFGGRNDMEHFGAAGTVYKEETARGPQYSDIKYDPDTNTTYVTAQHTYLSVDNTNQVAPWLFTMLMEEQIDFYEIDEVHITRYANIRLHHPQFSPNVTVIVHKFLGDRTGLFHLRKNQAIYVEVVESKTNESIAPCSYQIDAGAEIIFPSNVDLRGTRSLLSGLITGVHNLVITSGAQVIFESTAQTALVENQEYVHITPPGNFSFATFTVERHSRAEFQRIIHPMSLVVSEFRVKYQGQLYMNDAEIDSTWAWIESQGIFHLDARGHYSEEGPGAGFTTSDGLGMGAGHGGQGGGPPPYGGIPYNTVFSPLLIGSGGGNGAGTGGRGGGVLWWKVGQKLQLNGELALRGEDGSGRDAGGGSGGSALIEVTNMTGHGMIAVSGGQGSDRGGGGSGGRVGIHCRWRYQYGGRFIDNGGLGGTGYESSHGGAAGTIYKEENLRELEYRHKKYDKVHNTTFLEVDHTYIHIDNDGVSVPPATLIREEYTTEYEFDEMELTGAARLLIYHPDNETRVNLTVHLFIGDRSGQLHLRVNQTAFVEFVESVSNKTEAPCSYIIDKGAEIVLPAEFHVHGTNSTLKGLMIGVHHLYIEDGAWIQFYSSAQTGRIENRHYFDITPPGNFTFGTVTIKRGGWAGFLKITDAMTLESSELRVKYQGELYMNHVVIYSTYGWVESEGVFHFDGHGYPADTGPGRGSVIDSIGYGAAHGGEGGGANIILVSQPYGSIFTAMQHGSGGGSAGGKGGSGGGELHWIISHYLEMNGVLGSRGMPGIGGDSGGGSGGSVLIETTNMTGHGVIDVHGGDGVGQGGGGSGGRIAIHCRWRYTYGGRFIDRGGEGGIAHPLDHGAAAGTAYLEENLRPLQYRKRKYIKSTNETLLETDHHYLHVDNEGLLVPVASMILEEDTFTYEFDEMELTGASRLIIYHPDTPEGQPVNVTVHRFIGDRTGQLHLRNDQTVYVEVVESVNNKTEAPCSYIIDYGAEIVLPSEVHMHGTRTEIHGLFTGVHDLFIEDEADVIFTSTAQTAVVENREYVHITDEGNCSFPQLYIKKGGQMSFLKVLQDIIVDVDFLEIKYQGLFVMNHGLIVSDHADLESEGMLLLDGKGHASQSGPGAGRTSPSGYGTGASHGGTAGHFTNAHPGDPFGSVYTPLELGSGGGASSSGLGGSGGGSLHWLIGKLIHINGYVSASGQDAPGVNAGGGSGGSILIEATNTTGHGEVKTSGGKGSGQGAGGAGGRIGIHIRHQNNYGGLYTATGGLSGTSHSNPALGNGAAGTVYKYESRRGPQYRELKYSDPNTNLTEFKPEHSKLKIDNGIIEVDHPAIVMEEGTWFYEFDEVQIEGHSYLHFYHPEEAHNVTVVIHELTGNKKGLIRVQNRQRLFVHIQESTHTYLDAPCGFHVDWGGEIVLPTTIIILTEVVIIEGRLTGVEELIIERDGELQFLGKAHTAVLSEKSQWYDDEPYDTHTPGLLVTGKVSVNNQGKLTIRMNPTLPVLDYGEFFIKHGGLLSLETQYVNITCGELTVESVGVISSDGRGYGSRQGPGRGYDHGAGCSGAGHGAKGGSTAGVTGGSAYGRLSVLSAIGSGGGGASGGSGGGYIHLNVGKVLTCDGIVSANGLPGASDTAAGGGSGGSIIIDTEALIGHGTIQCHGGSAFVDNIYANGGGSGGRIAIIQTQPDIFKGLVQAHGGSSSEHGGPGTIYRRAVLGDASEHYLEIDNLNRADSKTCNRPVVVGTQDAEELVFTHIELLRRACLQLQSSSTEVNLYMRKLTGDGSGYIVSGSNHVIHIGYEESQTCPKANIHIQSSGMCILSPLSTITSTMYVQGALYGVENVKVKGEIKLYRSGYSACFNCSMESRERGDYYLGSLTVQNGGVLRVVSSSKRYADNNAVTLILHGHLDIDHGSTVEVGDAIVVYTQDMKVEKMGVVRANGVGYPGNSGPGKGLVCGGGGGGSYGGQGGNGDSCTAGIYGSQCLPTPVGSGGGSCSHGYVPGIGGGAIKAVSSRLLVMEGQIVLSGTQGAAGTGGGSGGALWLDGLYFEGWGYTSTNGGDATRHSYSCGWSTCYHYGGGGGGGRIRTYSPNDPHAVFTGRRRSSPGVGYNSNYNGYAGTLCVAGNECSGHGIWDEPTQTCHCEAGFVGSNCQVPCDPDITCSNHGSCADQGSCVCDPGYVGYRCEYMCDSTTTCSGNGDCSPHGECLCNDCYHGEDCSVKCSGHGECMSGMCECDACYIGEYCHSECNHHGSCSNDTCNCDEIWRGEYCTIAGCPGEDEDCSGNGICNAALHQCYCEPGWQGLDCTLPDCAGEPNCFDRGYCNVSIIPHQCQNCEPGWMGIDCNETCLHGVQQPMDSGICVCDPCWTAKGCNVECSAHGHCDSDTATCMCDPLQGWRGAVCEIPGCPGFGTDCTGHGDCNSALHECTCYPGWTGVGCHIPDCPGHPDCNDRGFCNGTLETPACQNCSQGWMGPACADPCVNGIQTPMDSGYCNCTSGWTGVGCDVECSAHGKIVDGKCQCDYDTGWKGELCDVPGCPGLYGLDCSGRGACDSALHKCVCDEGWYGLGCEDPDCPGDPDCAARGICNGTFDPPRCVNCNQGWMGPACEDPCENGFQDPMDSGFCNCNAGWTGVGCDAECSLHGTIIDETCVCDVGWRGEVCDIPGCPGDFGLDCSGHGECNSATHECTCNGGWTGDGCEIPDCPGSPDCNDRGHCNVTVDPPQCTDCIPGWMGADCNEPCTFGIQVPMDSGNCECFTCYTGKGCNSECSGNGLCMDGTCECEPGWWGEVCEVAGCPGEGKDCSGHGDCNSVLHQCFCYPGWTGDGCEIPDCAGEPDCNNKGYCNGTNQMTPVCHCIQGWMGHECDDPCTHGKQTPPNSGFCQCESCYSGAGCNSECSGNGQCDKGGFCTCNNNENGGFLGEKCEFIGCPGADGACNERGTCNSVTSKCTCYPGWTGLDCSIPDCPGNPSCSGNGECVDETPRRCACHSNWAGEVCNVPCQFGHNYGDERGCVCQACYSGIGCDQICNGNGDCVDGDCVCDFDTGYRGDVCQIPGCPGVEIDCSGHGTCNSATFECLCDPGWKGVGCQIPDCPGDPDCLMRGECPIPLEGEDPVCVNCDYPYMGDGCELTCEFGTPVQINSTWICECDSCYAGLACDMLCNNKSSICINETCDCGFDGWRGDVCDVPGCPGYGDDCTYHGECNRAIGMCYCDNGWAGIGCQLPDCPGTPDCNGRGDCVPEDPAPVCLNCHEDWMGPACEIPCLYGQQMPMDSGNCTCDPCYHGHSCNILCSGVGVCTPEGICDCGFSGGRGEFCDQPGCPGLHNTDCSGHGTCILGSCICDEGWFGEGCENPDCPGEPDCNNNGTCFDGTAIPECRSCYPGWMGEACEIPCGPEYGYQYPMDSGICMCTDGCWHGLSCHLMCGGVGSCDNQQCNCADEHGLNPGHWGDFCEQENCPGVGTPCTSHGLCTNDLQCLCDDGWIGDGCEIPDCPGEPDCTDHGYCNGTGDIPICECKAGWIGDACERPCVNGTAQSDGTCVCDTCFSGPGCDRECSGYGSCADDTCHCVSAWWGPDCSYQGCPGLGTNCTSHGHCNVIDQECYCQSGWKGDGCHIPDCPGIPDCNSRGACDGDMYDPPRCINCTKGWMGEKCEIPCTHGEQEPPNSGRCKCYPCYSGTNCDIECTDHGTCDEAVCQCQSGYTVWQ
ncbi:uncharacterized protein [Amphiura filiformis]|uniref:uncharacterized protein n=1 Tax=Amphiura filiformis TaxID=82378 RepID=UPI003B211F14